MGRPKLRYPKNLRGKKTKYESRLRTPFQEMSDRDIVYHYLRNNTFLKSYMNYSRQDYETCKRSIRETLQYVDEREFAKFVKICQEAFKTKGEDRRGFDNNIVALLQDLRKESNLLQSEEVCEEPICEQWIFPSSLIHNHSNTFLYDIAYDFFINDLDFKELMIRYELRAPELLKHLKEIKAEGITPLPI